MGFQFILFVYMHTYLRLNPCRTGIQTFRRENDRFWVVVAHPTQNLFAAGMYHVICIHPVFMYSVQNNYFTLLGHNGQPM